MKEQNFFSQTNPQRLVLGAGLLGTLTGCVAYQDRLVQGSLYEN